MSLTMFLIGFMIFIVYVVFLVWNIVYNGNRQQEENYPTVVKNDIIDMDGIGNQGRVPNIQKRKRLKINLFKSNKKPSVWDL
tara:strand:- start:198 stop:443 length:246 start_codon:yes stop_codon:yes gene_type:complete